jgi:hypothetical protein
MRANGLIFHAGHELTLLQGSTEFFPALIAAMDAARRGLAGDLYLRRARRQQVAERWSVPRGAACGAPGGRRRGHRRPAAALAPALAGRGRALRIFAPLGRWAC